MERWTTPQMLPWVALLSLLPGLCVGSFLNVCIYRWPREMSVNQPRRSFCPSCQRSLGWLENVPVVSWLVQRGRCRGCGMQIPMRYPVVELATALIFASVAAHFWLVDVRMVLPFWIFSSLLLVGAVVDVEFYLLPDQTTLGLAVIGVACSALVPAMHGVVGWKSGLGASLIGAATGFGMLWLVADLGKRFLGTVKYAFEEPVRFEWRRMGDLAEIRFDGETSSWNELFYRKGDRVRLGFTRMRLALSNGGVVEVTAGEVEAALERWIVGGSLYDLNAVDSIELEVTRLSLPREAMGFGDVKLMAGVGAFLGWKGAVVTVFGGACVGSLWAVLASLMGHRDWAARIPFGPFLSVVALAWVFFGAYLEPFLSRFRLVWEVVTEQAR